MKNIEMWKIGGKLLKIGSNWFKNWKNWWKTGRKMVEIGLNNWKFASSSIEIETNCEKLVENWLLKGIGVTNWPKLVKKLDKLVKNWKKKGGNWFKKLEICL